MAKSVSYRKEFFDREYTAKEAYSRLWQYARRYRFRIWVGIICGMLTAGTLIPFFQVIKPALSSVEAPAPKTIREESPKPAAEVVDEVAGASKDDAVAKRAKSTAKEYNKIRDFMAKFGIKLQSEDEELGLPLLFLAIVVVPLVALFRCGLVFLNHYCLAWAGMNTVRDIRNDIFRHVQAQSMQFHGRIDVGQLMSRCTSDPQQVRMIIQTVLQELAQAPFEIAVSVGFIIYSAISNRMLPTLGIIVFGFPLFMLPVLFLSKRIRKWSKKALERLSVVGSRIHEILTCIKVVKAYNTEEHECRKYNEAVSQTLKATMRSLRWGLLVGPAVETVGILLICAFLVWCYFAGVKLSTIIPMLAPLLIIYRPLKQLSKLQVQIEQGRAALARIWSAMDVEMELPENPAAQDKSSFEDKVVFKDVFFRYDTAERNAVDGVNFEILRGKVVAVVGGTGSGKSTMSSLLARFFDPQSGCITMDGTDLRDIKVADLRRLIGSVQQETLLFNDTIENNIKYGSPEATHEQVVAAAKMANAHDFIMSQPEGYERLAGEKGFALSGGERQRIAIARAILKNPPILILDEATSALDTVTERLVQDAINNLMKDRTTFAIAHRLSTIRNADLILVMQEGKIVERGTHDELYAVNGVYRKLCDMQSQK
ncbi:MAG: ABC transporter ATP-binding protein [Kiritimatiellia bacterium]|nr:ABC transporter ATP-binding protein [Kiritimatiellia bacterium]